MIRPVTTQSALLGEQAAEVWARMRERHLQRVDAIERAVLALMDGDLTEEMREQAESEAHALSGAAGTFGMRSGSRLARALEQTFHARHTLDRSLAARLADQVLALRKELERPLPVEAVAAGGEDRRRILLITDGDRAEQYLTEGLARGIEVIVAGLADGPAALTQHAPDAVVVELGPADTRDTVRLLAELGDRRTGPMLVVSTADGMEVRLAVAQCGALGPLVRTHPPSDVLQRVDALIEAQRQASGAVLVVDDDPYSVQLASLILEQAGHRVHTLSDPQRFWETLESVAPDLVVVGVAMSGVSGLDLCSAVRADPRWRELPVIFMASAGEADVIRDAYRVGADDVLRKPLKRDEFVARVENRLRRSRLLRRHAESDPMTGLANRKKAEREIDRFLRLARRHHHQVSLVLMRLDRVDDVGDRFGQGALDAVVLWFSHLLQQSFRTEDVVSRWGPNEFVIGLFDASAANATTRVREVMGVLRERQFHAADGQAFSLSCSAGIATFPEDATRTDELHAAADAALLGAGGGTTAEVLGVAGAPNTRATGRVDVLLVEDDASIATLLIHALESRQYVVRWLRDGKEAAAALHGEKPQVRARLVLLEVNLPGLDGLSVLRSLAAQEKLRHTKVVVLSSRTTEAETVQAFELGAFDYVAKPFSVAVLAERIKRALAT